MKIDLQFIAADSDRRKARAAAVIATFAAKLTAVDADPAHTFGWGEDSFKASADMRVWAEIANFLGRCARGEFHVNGPAAAPTIDHSKVADGVREMRCGDAVRILRREFEGRIMRAARYPARSTSICSNLVEQEILRASAEALEVFDSWLNELARNVA